MSFERNELEVAIIGISGRFPQGKDVEKFWQNLLHEVEAISVFSDSTLEEFNLKPNGFDRSKFPIKAGAVLDDIELFDAEFFGLNPREAETIDPQQRLFLECAWEALENAGYDSETEASPIGVYVGVGRSTYFLYNVFPHQEVSQSSGSLQELLISDKDYVPTRASYKLNLRGPSVSIQTACSSSLVAVHSACQSLLSGECKMALAAGVSVKVPQNELTLSPPEIVSPDGHCRAFDARANGTIGGNGIGVVVLKRLEDAIADRDYIYAVIKGSAVNNDGALKVGYTAPSEEGQAKVIRAAQIVAEVKPETISYMETHGTGTALGDPIEIAAMTRAFRASTDKKGYCAIGSVKTNVGHLDAAAGITGFIKTVLALHHKLIPPSLNFEQPNPQIDFANSPFYVNTKLQEWKANGTPRRAGVSSFGVGGTNAHVVLEEAPLKSQKSKVKSQSCQDVMERPCQLVCLSAKTESALEKATVNLANHLQQHPDVNLADVAYTLAIGRRAFDRRRMVVVRDGEDAVTALESVAPQRVLTQVKESGSRSVVFMFPGQGAQYINMAGELYQNEAIFRQECDRCFDLLQSHLGIDLRSCLYPTAADPEAVQQLQQTAITQPALFVIEYALAKLWMSWGVRPQAAIGHSIGEYVAACLSGVFSLEAALLLVATRGQLMQQLPKGAMLSVSLSADKARLLLNDNLSLAASNAPSLSVVSGAVEAIEQLERQLTQQGIDCRRLHTSHAFHSQMMEAIAAPFQTAVQKVKLSPPQIPFISNVTGTWITPAAATDPNYWVRHLRFSVQFSEGIAELLKDERAIFLEVGPGRTLNTLVKQQASSRVGFTSLRHPKEQQSDVAFLLNTLGRLWLTGVQVDWSGFYAGKKRDRLPLPTYPFERQRYWIDPPERSAGNTPVSLGKKPDITDWFYIPTWKRSIAWSRQSQQVQNSCTLVFIDECGLGEALVQRLQQQGQVAIAVRLGAQFEQLEENVF
ncbi:beta-ketoacyl synthase, partial [cyanobacterium TDX16]